MLGNSIREDLFITALEGGSNYWYALPNLEEADKYKKKGDTPVDTLYRAILHGEIFSVNDIENPKEELGEISLALMTAGELTMAKEQPGHFLDITQENWDVTTADIWFQYAVMGEVIFG